jgi:hypothetical protein
MTMPDERTRSLRFGWEFLIELRNCDSLTADQRRTVEAILLHYPSAAEIKQWALDCELGMPEVALLGQFLAPELPRPYVDPGEPVFPDDIERGQTTPQERVQALKDAYEFLRIGLTGSRKDNLPELLRRQLPYVLRHFPAGHEIDDWAQTDAREKALGPEYKQWLAPAVLVDEQTSMLVKLFAHWNLSAEDRLCASGLATTNPDTAAHFLGIHQNLRMLFPQNRDLAYGWMTTRNAALDDRSPIAVVREHGLTGLLMIRAYLEHALGQ